MNSDPTTRPTVLYVEDDAQSRMVMRMALKNRMGITRLTLFEDSSDFLARYQALDPAPDVIFLDIHMQPHTGFEMLRMLRGSAALRPGTPIVAMTASVMNEEVQALRTAGFDGCLAKPLDLDTFPDAFQRIVGGERVWRIIE
jgi:CheY-like chemotaxis protein